MRQWGGSSIVFTVALLKSCTSTGKVCIVGRSHRTRQSSSSEYDSSDPLFGLTNQLDPSFAHTPGSVYIQPPLSIVRWGTTFLVLLT